MIIGFDHAYWLTSPTLTWPQMYWVSTFPCLSWLPPQPCRKWLILKVQTNVKLQFSTHFPTDISHGKIIWNAGELATARAAASAGTIMVWKITTACDTFVITQYPLCWQLTICLFFFVFFRHCRHGLLLVSKRLTQLGQGYASSSFMYVLSAWTYKKHCLCSVRQTDIRMCHCLHQVYKDRNIVRQLVKRAEMAGFKAIALTVDTPRLGRREADIKNRC